MLEDYVNNYNYNTNTTIIIITVTTTIEILVTLFRSITTDINKAPISKYQISSITLYTALQYPKAKSIVLHKLIS